MTCIQEEQLTAILAIRKAVEELLNNNGFTVCRWVCGSPLFDELIVFVARKTNDDELKLFRLMKENKILIKNFGSDIHCIPCDTDAILIEISLDTNDSPFFDTLSKQFGWEEDGDNKEKALEELKKSIMPLAEALASFIETKGIEVVSKEVKVYNGNENSITDDSTSVLVSFRSNVQTFSQVLKECICCGFDITSASNDMDSGLCSIGAKLKSPYFSETHLEIKELICAAKLEAVLKGYKTIFLDDYKNGVSISCHTKNELEVRIETTSQETFYHFFTMLIDNGFLVINMLSPDDSESESFYLDTLSRSRDYEITISCDSPAFTDIDKNITSQTIESDDNKQEEV